ncbi:FAS1-like dehydratase domain-containing protein [Pseudogracilibacillus sp. SO30301A]|uniref:FAS1-like dehydratase domain-containing protein n=1 Tax=Pseudogracilibacillus sp. SO30301A TaxID=3098291 RepID=UPI00300E111E
MIDTTLIGAETEIVSITITREEVQKYCRVISEENPIYHQVQAARKAGYKDIPIPPTFPTLFWQALKTPWLDSDAVVIHSEQTFSYEVPLISNMTYQCKIILGNIRTRGNKQFLKHRLLIFDNNIEIATSETTLVLIFHQE